MDKYIVILFCMSIMIACDAKKRQVTHGNKDSFVKRSYGGSIGLERDSVMTPTKYRKLLGDTMKCTGKWCVDGGWGCRRGNSRDCYNVEHIIDKNGKEFQNYPECKNIPGNYIMAHGEWNQALGTLTRLQYDTSVAEKTRVYGSDIMKNARDSIRSCINKRYGRNIREDYQVNFTEDIITEIEEGLYVIPEGVIVECTDCDNVTMECDDCSCEECYIIPYVDEEYTEQTYLNIAMLCFIVSSMVILVIGVTIGYCVASHWNKNTVRQEVLMEQMIQ